ncbi:mono/diheme cytochrome c family protein [Mucilaginibacter frigoritolerans]|jgi:mono/diheme cytochrome c family protein|uniref:Mono/diheme cytochrome c family protein n=1 Tax=Mucilaginibacter frigoritolerans TaxID=652788 RepID=A0A562U2S9_9SPHI|nr:cytochrome c3 family protein [Mucilaginibacter frigoritolerans]TWJ00088.1 mono/diheme cytochrome c family protein [Mucilaginibacter frigoritolerans]
MRSFSLIFKQFSRSVLLIAGFAFLGFSAYAQGDAAKGEAIFKAKCTTCHKIDSKLIGPALGPTVTDETDDKWLTHWIENNQALIAAKDPKALKIYNEYNQSGMTVFGELTDGDVANILAYVRTTWKTMQAAPKPGAGTQVAAETGPSDLVIYALIGVIVLAIIIILVLNKVIATLERLLSKNKDFVFEDEAVEVVAVDRLAGIKKLAKNKKFVFFALLCGTLALGSWTWVTMWNTNVHQGYQPVQPIKFPHDLHAGAMKIDCQYCHSGAYKSKNASIPSLNVCMNCHKVVKTESPEIHKIYDALGYDPQTQKYDSTKARPIQWVRIHNLPDFAYFNHSQHVKVAGLKCQTCHGPVQTMKEVYQYSPLTMKWCIQCHKRTDVNTKGNAYYENMIAVHDLIKQGKKVSEAAMGGIECGKCHY